jgi:hypothetical protein
VAFGATTSVAPDAHRNPRAPVDCTLARRTPFPGPSQTALSHRRPSSRVRHPAPLAALGLRKVAPVLPCALRQWVRQVHPYGVSFGALLRKSVTAHAPATDSTPKEPPPKAVVRSSLDPLPVDFVNLHWSEGRWFRKPEAVAGFPPSLLPAAEFTFTAVDGTTDSAPAAAGDAAPKTVPHSPLGMWWAHTINPRIPMDSMATTMPRRPKMGRRA